MNGALMLIGAVILICILMDRFLEKLAVPSLLIFLGLGMCFGENGLFRIPFDDYAGVNLICSFSLVIIMFYGGFGTNLKAARPVAVQAGVLATLGVAGTAGAVGLFAHLALELPWLESMLIGSVISSTDAASVFSILRSKKLALKHHTDSLLEMESGSNDPISYMLTTVVLTMLAGRDLSLPLLLAKQLLL
ncbi:cation:proton antiporter, partial [Pseudoflavonifractor phocaeensis]